MMLMYSNLYISFKTATVCVMCTVYNRILLSWFLDFEFWDSHCYIMKANNSLRSLAKMKMAPTEPTQSQIHERYLQMFGDQPIPREGFKVPEMSSNWPENMFGKTLFPLVNHDNNRIADAPNQSSVVNRGDCCDFVIVT